jgi:SAC3 family protein LENG8/THP3
VQDAVTASKKSVGNDGEWDRYMGEKTIGGSHKKLDETDNEKMTIRGTCQTLKKSYLRLTAPPRAELVRPEPILAKHLANVRQERAQRGSSAKSHDYLWFCLQLKAIRQDCTVQRIQSAFAVDVYELHAKIALEEDDLNEYNQCQTQLKELYDLLSSTSDGAYETSAKSQPPEALRHYNEFLAYWLV